MWHYLPSILHLLFPLHCWSLPWLYSLFLLSLSAQKSRLYLLPRYWPVSSLLSLSQQCTNIPQQETKQKQSWIQAVAFANLHINIFFDFALCMYVLLHRPTWIDSSHKPSLWAFFSYLVTTHGQNFCFVAGVRRRDKGIYGNKTLKNTCLMKLQSKALGSCSHMSLGISSDYEVTGSKTLL